MWWILVNDELIAVKINSATGNVNALDIPRAQPNS